jgi:hypothetical protein
VSYLDDILITIFGTTKINSHTTNTYISNIHNTIKLNPTHEEHSSIDSIDLTISRERKQLTVNIYRKPTTTERINLFSNRPTEQKMAAYNYHITRMAVGKIKKTKKNGEKYQQWLKIIIFYDNCFRNLTDRYSTKPITKKNRKERQQELDHIHLPQPQDKKNYQYR